MTGVFSTGGAAAILAYVWLAASSLRPTAISVDCDAGATIGKALTSIG